MKRYATFLLISLFLYPSNLLAGNWQNSDTAANKCDGLARACSRAARELKAARELIEGYESQIAAADARIELARKEIASLKKISMLSEAKTQELEAVITAERDAKAALVALKTEQEKRIAKLEKKLSRSRKLVLIFGVAAGVAILVGARR